MCVCVCFGLVRVLGKSFNNASGLRICAVVLNAMNCKLMVIIYSFSPVGQLALTYACASDYRTGIH